MTPPARRDGTPEKKQRASDKLVSNAKPARHQHVKKKRPATADSVARDLGADWLVEDNAKSKRNGGQSAQGERLQKVLAKAGVASRRHAEILIDEGRVEVNGQVIITQGTRVNPNADVIRVDGVRINVNEDTQYFVLNKPRGMQSTMSDDMGRPCVGDVVADRVVSGQRLFHVGRLDADTEGLLLLTNDGELAHRLMHPSFEVPKSYVATVLGSVPRGLGKKLRGGVELDDGPVQIDDFAVVDTVPGKTLVRVTLHEGRKHIVRRLLAEVGFPVQELVRTDIGAVSLGDQRPGSIRVLTQKEIGELYKAVGL